MPHIESTALGGLVPRTESTAFGGLVPLAESTVSRGLVPRTEHTALGGLLLTFTAFHDCCTHEPRIGLTAFLLPRGDSSLVFLPPSPPPKAVPAAGRSFLPLSPFRFGFCHTHRRRHGLRRRPGSSDAHRTVDSSIKEFYPADRLRRDHRFICVRLCLAWHSSPSVVDDAPTSSDSNG